MGDLLFPPSAGITQCAVDVVSNTLGSRSRFTGQQGTVGFGGDRYRFRITASNANDRERYARRASLMSTRASLRGAANRIWFADQSYQQRGSFPSQELLINNSFANGATNWTAINAALSVQDRVMRVTSSSFAATGLTQVTVGTTTQYAPYTLRSFVAARDIADGTIPVSTIIDNGIGGAAYSGTDLGLRSISSLVYQSSLAHYPGYGAVIPASQSFDIPWCSLSRSFLVDNGQNQLLYSEQFNNAAWVKRDCTITPNGLFAPDGAATADTLVENSATAGHYTLQYIGVSSNALDICFSVVISAYAGRQFCYLAMDENTTSAVQYFNLTTGLPGITSSLGSNWSNLRAFTKNLGGGWIQCCIIARKTSSATLLAAYVGSAISDSPSGNLYLGSGSNSLGLWRATVSLSGVPARLVLTASAAVSAGTLQGGTALYVKGLPPSTQGLLLVGDRIQIGTQLNIVTVALNSDAAGLGYLQCAIPWRTSPADGDPVIVNSPMALCRLVDNVGGWTDSLGGFSEHSFEIEECCE